MQGQVARKSNENSLEIWHFNLTADLSLRFHKYELWKTHEGTAERTRKCLWVYPDLTGKSNIEQPPLPEWAIDEAKTNISTRIRVA